jgi:hypothetical protein
MERLTRKCGDEYLQPLYLANSGKGFTSTKDVVNRLAEYENTGLTPEEIQKMKEKQTPKQVYGAVADLQNRYCPSCHEWMIFEKTGRVNYCPSCGQALKWD